MQIFLISPNENAMDTPPQKTTSFDQQKKILMKKESSACLHDQPNYKYRQENIYKNKKIRGITSIADVHR